MAATLPSLFLSAASLFAAALYFRSSNMVAISGAAAATTTHLHFYMHDDYTGPRPTAMRVVSGRSLLPSSPSSDDDGGAATGGSLLLPSSSSPRQFGDMVVLNNALTEGPGGDSARVGTAQGFAVRVSEGGVVSHLTMHLVLDAGEHRGSSVTVSGRIDMDAEVRESVVVGGTGAFRSARGYMLTRDYDYSLARGGVIEIDVYLQH